MMSRSSALPRLTPRATPLSASTSVLYDTYPARLPSAPDIPQRINPLKPPPPTRRTVALETKEPHWHNEHRALRMKQREHYRYHNAWSKYYYGAPAEQEAYRYYLRSVLKQQMVDKWQVARQQLHDKVVESERAVERDRQDRTDDGLTLQRRHTYLTTFRDDNKKLMEWKWAEKRHTRDAENKYDREQLKYNPINWSCSLK